MTNPNHNTSPCYPPSLNNSTDDEFTLSTVSSDSDELMVDVRTGLVKDNWREWFVSPGSDTVTLPIQPLRALHETYDSNHRTHNELSFVFGDGDYESEDATGPEYESGAAHDPHCVLLKPYPNAYSFGGTPSRRTESTPSVYTDKIISITQCGFSLSWDHKATVVLAIVATFPGTSRATWFFATRDPQAIELLASLVCGNLDVALPCIIDMVNGDQFLIVRPGTFAYRASPGFISPIGFAPSLHPSRSPNGAIATEVFHHPFFSSSSSSPSPTAPQLASPAESSDTNDSELESTKSAARTVAPAHVAKIAGPKKRGRKSQPTPVTLCDFAGCLKPSGEKPQLNPRHVSTPQHSNQVPASDRQPVQMLYCSYSHICKYQVSRNRKDTFDRHEATHFGFQRGEPFQKPDRP
ncbi:hypothetical protein FIBSPDRAFT_931573 [Athelia psychrophila]|uniref:Uncharacterized protein n=1 Tax=Athelia psychrophila TaxID=1759441 RepID=A0A166K566_9AGAM|nr:hypothetical protein FIBSPDRAFT_931573 [Fibularhizoctonia sp. CBS 109695]